MNEYLFSLFFALISGFRTLQMGQLILFVRKMQQISIPAQGVVISQRQVQRGRGYETDWVPLVEYQTLEGQPIRGESWKKEVNVEFFDGDEVYLHYDPAQPIDFLFVQELVWPPYWQLAVVTLFLMMAVVIIVKTALRFT